MENTSEDNFIFHDMYSNFSMYFHFV